ncbi:hypothetical protein M0805_002567 [Coniferiporia weirii]|nr:hypothetical protein M0805_002567 [Coniferiporia weirii]
MPASRRGSGSVTLPSGQTLAIHTRTQDEEDLPHATKKTMADHLRKYESLFTLTPQRMRMITEAFSETLDTGLKKHEQIVPMIPTFVFGWPTGDELGDYLALDLGGTNLRVCLKLISGRYLGEILRLVICELIDEGVLFLGQNTYKLEKPYCFDTAFLSLMESDPTDELLMIIGIFTHFFALETTLAERQFFRALARLVGRRAARLSSCGIAAIVSKMGYLDEGCSVGADGSLYNKYPGFADRVHEGLVDIFGDKGRNIITHHAEDGSGVGSAIIAAMTKKRKDAGIYAHV